MGDRTLRRIFILAGIALDPLGRISTKTCGFPFVWCFFNRLFDLVLWLINYINIGLPALDINQLCIISVLV